MHLAAPVEAHKTLRAARAVLLEANVPALEGRGHRICHAGADECCGFAGTFSIFEEAVSAKMGYDKVHDHARAGAEYIVSADSSCMMHQWGCAERIGLSIKFTHIAQILKGASA